MHNNDERRSKVKKITRYVAMFVLAVLFAVYPFKQHRRRLDYISAVGEVTRSIPIATEDDWDDYYDDVDLDIDENVRLGAPRSVTPIPSLNIRRWKLNTAI